MMEGRFSAIDREVIRLAESARPRVCFLPTPTGDAQEVLERFYSAYDPWCEARQLTPFRKATQRSIPLRTLSEELLTFDVILVSGGSTKSALAVWKEWGIDGALRKAYDAGVLLCGMSAGAICWFEYGFTDSFGDCYVPLRGLGFLKGGCSVHHNDESARGEELLKAIGDGKMPTTLAINDFAAVLFHNDLPTAVYAWKRNATAQLVEKATTKANLATTQFLTTPLIELTETQP